jgi:hypothetical protein
MAIRSISATIRNLNPKDFKERSAKPEDCSTLIDEDTIVTVDGRIVLVYIAKVDEDMREFVDALGRVNYLKSYRSNGLLSTARIFGYAPRNAVRNHPCRAATLSAEQPTESQVVQMFAEVAAKYYRQHNPAMAAEHDRLTLENVRPEYRMGDTMFTSGIINHNNPLRYHFDSGNYKNVWSAMFAFKKDIEGGYLAIPELDMCLKCTSGSLTLFDGQSLIHGVTPIRKLSENAVRYTVVFYSLKQMWNCELPKDEVSRIRQMRAEIELKKRNKKS